MRLRFVLLTSLLLTFTTCMRDPNADFRASQPDRILFARARSAIERNHLDVARMTLQTLNTYPDSEYAAKAQRVLDDPRMRACGSSEHMQFGNGSSEPCTATGTPSASSEELDFFTDPNALSLARSCDWQRTATFRSDRPRYP
jgi:outer membrane protein assembly factor BamD (BamD/ComL family)